MIISCVFLFFFVIFCPAGRSAEESDLKLNQTVLLSFHQTNFVITSSIIRRKASRGAPTPQPPKNGRVSHQRVHNNMMKITKIIKILFLLNLAYSTR